MNNYPPIIPSAIPTSIPDWMLYFAFWASLTLTILAIAGIIKKTTQKNSLKLILTKELFFRILQSGEFIYSHGVLVAYGSGALIEDAKAELIKKDGAKKTFKLGIAKVGEKVRTTTGNADYFFPSYSPITFIPINQTQHIAYVWEQKDYSEKFSLRYRNFENEVNTYVREISDINQVREDPDLFKKTIDDLSLIVNRANSEIADQIQIESGEYSFVVTIIYKQKRDLFPGLKTKKAKSILTFTMEPYAREMVKYSMKYYLEEHIVNTVQNKPDDRRGPEYEPSNIKDTIS